MPGGNGAGQKRSAFSPGTDLAMNSGYDVHFMIVLASCSPVRSKWPSSRTRHKPMAQASLSTSSWSHLLPGASSCNVLLQRVLKEDPLLRTGLCHADRSKPLRHRAACVVAYTAQCSLLISRFSLVLAGKSDSASSRTVSVRDDAPEPTGTYLWRVLEGALSL